MGLKAVFAKEIGTRISLRVYWGHDECSGWCHNSKEKIKDVSDIINNTHYGGEPEDYPDDMWPMFCYKCGESVPKDANRQVFNQRLYDTPSGELEPGNIFWNDWYPENLYWDNHKGPHLMAVLPNGNEWCIDSRASNCTMPEDRTHRCWCRHGEPPDITVDKNGHTCAAGAGSIMSGDYHGFLTNGVFSPSI